MKINIPVLYYPETESYSTNFRGYFKVENYIKEDSTEGIIPTNLGDAYEYWDTPINVDVDGYCCAILDGLVQYQPAKSASAWRFNKMIAGELFEYPNTANKREWYKQYGMDRKSQQKLTYQHYLKYEA